MLNRSPADLSPPPASSRLRDRLLMVIAAAALFWLLREAYAVVMPAVAALLLALAVWPLVAAIHDRVPRKLSWLGPLTGTLVVLGILVAFFVGLGFGASAIYDLAIGIAPRLRERLEGLPIELPAILQEDADLVSEAMAMGDQLMSGAMTVLSLTATSLGGLVLVLFLMLMMLSEAANWNAKLHAVADSRRDTRRWLDIGESVGAKFRTYFLARLLIGVVGGVLYGGFLFAMGVEYVVLWGLLAILLSFIPTIGSIISGVLPTIYVFVTRDFGDALIVAAGLLVIEQVLGNFLDPKLMGRRLAVSPLVVLLALLLWTLVWGFAGALLAVPITVLLTVVMAHFERTKPAALMLTERDSFEGLEDYRRPD